MEAKTRTARAGVGADDTVSVSWVANRLKVSTVTVLRYREQGLLEGFQFVPRGWWRITKASVIVFEKRINASFQS